MPWRAPTTGEYGRWQVEDQPLVVECSLLVLEELRQAGEQGFKRIPHGGIEIGALLFGGRMGDVVRIEDWRPIECKHARGPGFILSEDDMARMGQLLEECRASAELEGLEPVGWFHTHTRSDIFFSPEDIAVHERFFPEPWQAGLVMRFRKNEPQQAGFFLRQPGGRVPGEASSGVFPVEANPALPVRPARQSPAAAKPAASRAPAPRELRTPAVLEEPAAEHPSAARPQPLTVLELPVTSPLQLDPHIGAPPRPPFRWSLLLGLMAVVMAAAAAVVTRPYWSSSGDRGVQLKVEESAGQMVIGWDHASAVVRRADRGMLRVSEAGRKLEIPLEATEIHDGGFTVATLTGEAEIGLTLFEGQTLLAEETARFRAQQAPAQIVRVPGEPVKDRKQLITERKRLTKELKRETARSRKLKQSMKALEEKLNQDQPAEKAP